MSTLNINVNVTGKHVREGVCSDMSACAIAQALVDSGFKHVGVSSSGSNDAHALLYSKRKLTLEEHLVSEPVTVSLGKKAGAFVDAFDALEDGTEAAREKMAKRYDKKPLALKVTLDKKVAKKVLTKKAFDTLTASTTE